MNGRFAETHFHFQSSRISLARNQQAALLAACILHHGVTVYQLMEHFIATAIKSKYLSGSGFPSIATLVWIFF
jgi:hypothetical protein